jgi:group I intron endonuclease
MKIIKRDGSKQAFNSGIYVIHTPENYIYIGQSINLNRRLKDYTSKSSRIKGQPKIYESIDRLGWDGHHFTILEYCSKELLNERERYWQDKFDCTNPLFGLNVVLQNSTAKRREFSKEYRDMLSEKNKGSSNPFYGKKHTQENKEKWSKQMAGKNNLNYGLKGEEHPAYGNKLSQESREKISERLKGIPKTKEHNEKVKQSLIKVKGRKIIRVTDGKTWDSVSLCTSELNIPTTTFYRNIKKENNKFNLKYL